MRANVRELAESHLKAAPSLGNRWFADVSSTLMFAEGGWHDATG